MQPHSGVQVHPCIELPVAAKKQYCKRKNIYISLKVFDTGIVRLCFHKFLELFYNKKTILQKIYFMKFHFWSETETSLCYKFLLFSEISWIILHHLTSKIDYEISATGNYFLLNLINLCNPFFVVQEARIACRVDGSPIFLFTLRNASFPGNAQAVGGKCHSNQTRND